MFNMLSVFFLSLLPFTLFAKEQLDLDINYYIRPEIAMTFEAVLIKSSFESIVVLSDASQWIIRNKSDAEILNEISMNWKLGDEIRIGCRTPEKCQGKYILKNMRNDAVCLADLSVICQDRTRAYFIEQIDENGYAILTQDGSQWAIGWYGAFTTSGWRKGDRVIINKSSYSGDSNYLLINADKGDDVWAGLVNWR